MEMLYHGAKRCQRTRQKTTESQMDAEHAVIDPRVQETLVSAAREATGTSYSPYSRFRVGAALLCEDGTIVTGVNVENRSYGLTICAERSAVVSAIAAGHSTFRAIAIYGADADSPLSPCGACRQVISEFMPPDALVICVDRTGRRETYSLAAMLPHDGLHELRDRPTR